jgi:LysM repeat protein
VAAPTTGTANSTVVHRVRSGETLYAIARLYRTTVAALKNWNKLTSNLIQPGQRLRILATATVATN